MTALIDFPAEFRGFISLGILIAFPCYGITGLITDIAEYVFNNGSVTNILSGCRYCKHEEGENNEKAQFQFHVLSFQLIMIINGLS